MAVARVTESARRRQELEDAVQQGIARRDARRPQRPQRLDQGAAGRHRGRQDRRVPGQPHGDVHPGTTEADMARRRKGLDLVRRVTALDFDKHLAHVWRGRMVSIGGIDRGRASKRYRVEHPLEHFHGAFDVPTRRSTCDRDWRATESGGQLVVVQEHFRRLASRPKG